MRRILFGRHSRIVPNNEIESSHQHEGSPPMLRNENESMSVRFPQQINGQNAIEISGGDAVDANISEDSLNLSTDALLSPQFLGLQLNTPISVGRLVNKNTGIQVSESDFNSHPIVLENAGAIGAQGILDNQGHLKVIIKTTFLVTGVIYILPSAVRKIRNLSNNGNGGNGGGSGSSTILEDNSGNDAGEGLLFYKKNTLTVEDIPLFVQYQSYIVFGFLGATLLTVYIRNPRIRQAVDKHLKSVATQFWQLCKWFFPWLRPLWLLFKIIWRFLKPFLKYLRWLFFLLKFVKNLYLSCTLLYFLYNFLPVLKKNLNKILGIVLKTELNSNDGVYLALRNIIEQLFLGLTNLLLFLVKLISLIISSINSFIVSTTFLIGN